MISYIFYVFGYKVDSSLVFAGREGEQFWWRTLDLPWCIKSMTGFQSNIIHFWFLLKVVPYMSRMLIWNPSDAELVFYRPLQAFTLHSWLLKVKISLLKTSVHYNSPTANIWWIHPDEWTSRQKRSGWQGGCDTDDRWKNESSCGKKYHSGECWCCFCWLEQTGGWS